MGKQLSPHLIMDLTGRILPVGNAEALQAQGPTGGAGEVGSQEQAEAWPRLQHRPGSVNIPLADWLNEHELPDLGVVGLLLH